MPLTAANGCGQVLGSVILLGSTSEQLNIVLCQLNMPQNVVITPVTQQNICSSIAMSEPLFLGLDLSTQQLKALLITEKAIVVHELAVGYDRDLPRYGTTNGAIHGPGDGQVTSPVAMWVEALDLILRRMKDAGVDFARIRAVSGAGQVRSSYAPI